MNEVKTPKKPLIAYYCIVILLLLLFNMLVMPMISQRQVKEVDYNTFMEMTYERQHRQGGIAGQSDPLYGQGQHAAVQNRPDERPGTNPAPV